MAKFRVVQREGIYYPQQRKFFVWGYLTEPDSISRNMSFTVDRYGCLGFEEFEDAKQYLRYAINSGTKVVYEIET